MKVKGYFFATASGFFYGALPIMIVGVSKTGIASNTCILMIRYCITSVLLIPPMIIFIRMKKPTITQVVNTVFAGVLMTFTAVFIYSSYQWLPSGIGMAISYFYPLFVIWFGVVFRHKRAEGAVWLAEGLSILGMLFLCDFPSLREGSWKGIVYAVFSGVLFAGYLILGEEKKLGEIHPIVFTGILSITCSFCLLLFNLSMNQMIVLLSGRAFLQIAIAGIIGALAIAAQIAAVKYIGSVLTSLLGLFELVVCCLGSVIVLKDSFSVRSAIGVVLILFSAILVMTRSSQTRLHRLKGKRP